MKKAPLVPAIAACLLLGSLAAARAADGGPEDEARVAEQQVLGAGDDEARFQALQPFTREIARTLVIASTLGEALGRSDLPNVVALEALKALAATVNLERDLKPGDRFHVRYEQAFTAAGAPVGVGRVLWAELALAKRAPVVVHRFKLRDQAERLWFVNGLSATPPSMRLPLETVSVSSGFGLRADPFDQPRPLSATGRAEPMGGPAGVQTYGGGRVKVLPPGLPTGGPSGNGGSVNIATPLGASPGLNPYGGFRPAPSRAGGLFMHEGIDLVAPNGTPVYAAADGVVVGAAPNGRYGNWIRIDHGNRIATQYGHLSGFAPGIEPGQTVAKGDLIGFVGSTGRSTGAHLHFEVLENGKAVNPVTHPELKAVQLRGPDLERFRKLVARSTEERAREEKVAAVLR